MIDFNRLQESLKRIPGLVESFANMTQDIESALDRHKEDRHMDLETMALTFFAMGYKARVEQMRQRTTVNDDTDSIELVRTLRGQTPASSHSTLRSSAKTEPKDKGRCMIM